MLGNVRACVRQGTYVQSALPEQGVYVRSSSRVTLLWVTHDE